MGGKANLPLLKQTTIITSVVEFFSTEANAFSTANAVMLVGVVSVAVVIFLLWLMFSTEFGFALRATGDNPRMISALGVNTDIMIILGLMISNGLISLSGGLIAQYNGYADVGMGVGTIVIGLASVIIGEVLLGRRGMAWCLTSVVVGSILYRIIIAFVLANKLPILILLSILLFIFSILSTNRRYSSKDSCTLPICAGVAYFFT
jgi:putative ABC transport system permease protein